MDNTFDFMTQPEAEDTAPQYIGPNKKSRMTPKKFASSILDVYDTLGGASWLLIEAKSDPKAFMSLLTKLIPKSIQLDGLAGFSINLIDQFGASVEIQAASQPLQSSLPVLIPPAQEIGHSDTDGEDICKTATGGSLTSTSDTEVPEYTIMDIFEG